MISQRAAHHAATVLLLALAGPLVVLVTAGLARAATFTVDSTGDGADADPGNGTCATSGAVCTLRAAIEEGAALAGVDTTAFSIPGAGPHTITLTSALPSITEDIDGFTEPGSDAGDLLAGTPPTWMIRIDADGITNAGLGVIGATVQGVEVFNVAGSNSSAYCISLAGVGATAIGTLTHDCQGGIVLSDNASAIGNVAHSHRLAGITTLGDDTLVRGNIVCLEPDGVTQATQTFGVFIEAETNAVIGGTETGHRNIISGCGTGVSVKDSSVTGATIRFNYIGPDVNGSTANAALCNEIDDNGAGTTIADNTLCPEPTPTATATGIPILAGCCNIAPGIEGANCLDESFAGTIDSLADCQAIADGFGSTASGFNPDALCDPDPSGSCPAPAATATSTATATATATHTGTATATEIPTNTATATETGTNTATSTPTNTGTATYTPTATGTATVTSTPTATLPVTPQGYWRVPVVTPRWWLPRVTPRWGGRRG